jgi:DNA polymerase-3 subunit alpha
MLGIAITDKCSMGGIMDFFDYVNRINKERKETGKKTFKPIIGCELDVAGVTTSDKAFQLTVLAKNLVGYKNLMKLVSLSHISYSELQNYHEGLIVCSGGIESEVYAKAASGDMTGLCDVIKWYQQIFADDYYLELQRTAVEGEGQSEQEKVNQMLIQKAQEYGIKLVCTNDVHYLAPKDLTVYNTQRCIALDTTMDKYDAPVSQRWLRSKKEMCHLFADVPEAISNTMEIFDKVEEYNIHHAPVMPKFAIPKEFENEEDYLEHLTYTKAKCIYGNPLPEDVLERIQYELQVIKKGGSAGYFLFMQDVVNTAQSKLGVTVGPGRVSAAGCLVSYCLGITKIDPLKYDLLFERFLDPDRNIFPDIDLDLDEEGREKVLQWLTEKYGAENVAHIITHGMMAPKLAIRDVARVQESPLAAKKIAQKLEGTIRNTGVHACGFVVCDSPISDWAPVTTVKTEYSDMGGVRCVQYDGHCIESTGLVKLDFLSLNTLSQLKGICEAIKDTKGVDIDIENIPADDSKTLELFQQGDTEDVFQFGSQGMQTYLRELHPTRFEDLAIVNSMYRPASMDELPLLISRKNGKRKITYALPCMERYLRETYGTLVYQEQLMLLSQEIAGFSKSESDTLRRAICRMNQNRLSDLKPQFIEGGIRNGYKKRTLERIWTEWEENGMRLFNKSHAVCYSWLGYQMAYLKANYPEEFETVMNNYKNRFIN